MKKPVLLMILDGWGIAPADKTNAAAMAKLPTWTVILQIILIQPWKQAARL